MTWWTDPVSDVDERCRAVIVGSGAGGAFAACTLAEAGIDAATAYDAAFADEHFQIARWGEDAEQAERLALLRRDLDDLARIRDALNAG